MIQILIAAAIFNGVPPDIFVSMCFVESSHRANVINHYDGGEHSYGVCQIQYSAARDVGYRGTRRGLLDPATNADVAAKYFRRQLDRYSGNVVDAVVAYNAGRSIKYRRYVDKVFANAVKFHMDGK